MWRSYLHNTTILHNTNILRSVLWIESSLSFTSIYTRPDEFSLPNSHCQRITNKPFKPPTNFFYERVFDLCPPQNSVPHTQHQSFFSFPPPQFRHDSPTSTSVPPSNDPHSSLRKNCTIHHSSEEDRTILNSPPSALAPQQRCFSAPNLS